MRVAITEETMTVKEAPVGLLILGSGEVIMKTEYAEKSGCECYIVSSGERFHGEGDAVVCRALVLL